jgi:hypothetical protein
MSDDYLCKDLTCNDDVCNDENVIPPGTPNDLRKCFMCKSQSGKQYTRSDFTEAWTIDNLCNQSLDPPQNDITLEQLLISQKKANRALAISMGTEGDSFDTSGSDRTQNKILNICKGGDQSSSPGACGNYIENKLVPKNYDYSSMTLNPGLANWMGCFIPPPPDQKEVYDTQFQLSVTPLNACTSFGIGATPCYPMCHRISTIQKYANRQSCNCGSNVCVIDDVTVTAVDSQVDNFNITQMCPGCSPQNPCTCITSSTDLSNTFEELGISSSFNQFCGDSNSACYDTSGGNLDFVTCQNFLDVGSPALSVAVPIFVIVGGILLFFIVVTVMFASSEERIIVKKKKKKRGEIIYDHEGDNNEGQLIHKSSRDF